MAEIFPNFKNKILMAHVNGQLYLIDSGFLFTNGYSGTLIPQLFDDAIEFVPQDVNLMSIELAYNLSTHS